MLALNSSSSAWCAWWVRLNSTPSHAEGGNGGQMPHTLISKISLGKSHSFFWVSMVFLLSNSANNTGARRDDRGSFQCFQKHILFSFSFSEIRNHSWPGNPVSYNEWLEGRQHEHKATGSGWIAELSITNFPFLQAQSLTAYPQPLSQVKQVHISDTQSFSRRKKNGLS